MSVWQGIIRAKDEFKTYNYQNESNELNFEFAKESAKIIKKAIKTESDLFLYCAALNYLNAFNKKFPNDIIKIFEREYCGKIIKNGYYFKLFVNHALDSLIQNDLALSSFYIEKNGKLVIIDVGGVQFVFHNIKILKSTKELINQEIDKRKKQSMSKYLYEKLDGLRLQPIATKVLDYAMNLENLTVYYNGKFANENE